MKKSLCLLLVVLSLLLCSQGLADSLYPGCAVKFGSYEQDGNYQNGPEAIDWIVVSCDEQAVVMISKYGLDCVPYHTYKGDVLWADSSLRYWLNNVFYNKAFSQSEKAFMLAVGLENPENPEYGTYAGGMTQDIVFVPNVYDAQWHSMFNMQAAATRYAVQQGVHTKNGYCWWWLRTPGKHMERVAHVTYEGKIYYEGTLPTTNSGAVRPCIVLDATMLR